MDKKFLFTHERLDKLQAPESGRFEYFDTKQQKLRLRVTTTGAKSFAVVKKVNNKPKRVTIGKWPEISIAKAREAAIKILDDLRRGVDPIAEKRKKRLQSSKLKDVLEQYLSGRELKSSTKEDYRYKLKLGFEDWFNLPVSEITEDMVLKKHKVISKRGKTTANTTMRVLRLTMKYAVATRMIESPPTRILNEARLWHKNKRKVRIIPSDKLQSWHKAVEALPNQKAKVYLLMVLYLGFRSDETLTLEWSNVDWKAKTITAEDTKNGTPHTLSIPDPLFSQLEELKNVTGDYQWVFAGRNPDKPMSLPSKPIEAVIDASGVEFSSHDCRRTFATIAEAVNLPLTIIKRMMNHNTQNDVTGGYIVTEEETLREAINKVANYIQVRVARKGNVIKLYTKNN